MKLNDALDTPCTVLFVVVGLITAGLLFGLLCWSMVRPGMPTERPQVCPAKPTQPPPTAEQKEPHR